MTRARHAVSLAFVGMLLGACATVPPEKAALDALKWDVARECQSRFASVTIGRPDHLGRLPFGARIAGEGHAFRKCYQTSLSEQRRATSGAGPADVSADIVQEEPPPSP